jgi:hypothetical protein
MAKAEKDLTEIQRRVILFGFGYDDKIDKFIKKLVQKLCEESNHGKTKTKNNKSKRERP